MFAFSSSSSNPRLFLNNRKGWSFGELSEQNCIDKVAAEFFFKSPLFDLHFTPPMEVDDKSLLSTMVGVDDLLVSKRLNHNASERERQKKINLLFSSLRSILLPHDQGKRLSPPATVSVALKYIPNLQKQVEELVEKKKQLMCSMITRRQEESSSSLLAVSTNSLSEREVVVQIVSTFHGIPLSWILLGLHEDGLHPLNISSSLSFGGRIFYQLHLQVEKDRGRMESKILNDKVMRLYDNINYFQTFF